MRENKTRLPRAQQAVQLCKEKEDLLSLILGQQCVQMRQLGLFPENFPARNEHCVLRQASCLEGKSLILQDYVIIAGGIKYTAFSNYMCNVDCRKRGNMILWQL